VVYDRIHHPAAGGFDTDICPHSYCGADTYTHSDRADTNTNAYAIARVNSYSHAYTGSWCGIHY
jgi:hypothetical protein